MSDYITREKTEFENVFSIHLAPTAQEIQEVAA